MATPQSVIDAAAQRRAERAAERGNAELVDKNLSLIKDATPVTPSMPTTDVSGVPVDEAAEQQTIANLGFTPSNDQEVLDMAIMTYGENLPPKYEELRKSLEGLKGGGVENIDPLSAVGADISKYGQDAAAYAGDVATQKGQIPMQLNILQDALKMTSGVGNQPLGTSEIFEQAGVTGYGALNAALSSRAAEMNYKYDSFSNLVGRIAGVQYGSNAKLAAEAEKSLAQYEMLMNEYQFEQSRLDKISADAEAYEKQLDLLDRQHQYSLEELGYKAELDASSAISWRDLMGSGTVGTGSTYTGSDGTIYVAPGYSGAAGERKVIGKQGDEGVFGSEFANNCVKYARLFVPNLPYGLWNTSDKAAIVDTSITEPQIGDAMLTAEGPYGHATVVTGYDPSTGTITVREANYSAGTITDGRTLNINDVQILGFVRPDESKVLQVGMSGGIGKANENFVDKAHNYMKENYEGMNPQGAETFLPSANYSITDFAQAYENSLIAQGKSFKDAEASATLFAQSIYQSGGDFEAAKQTVYNSAVAALSADEKADVRSRKDMNDALAEVKLLIDDYVASGKAMGWVKGSVEKTYNEIQKTSDPDLLEIGNRLAIIQDNYAKMKTGAASSAYEDKLYQGLFSTVKADTAYSTASIDTMIDSLVDTNETLVGDIMGPGLYEKFFGRDTLLQEYGFSSETGRSVDEGLNTLYSF